MIVARTRAIRRHSRIGREKDFFVFKRVKDKLSLSAPHFLLLIPICKIKSFS